MTNVSLSSLLKTPEPSQRARLELTAVFSSELGERMRQGFDPQDMDHKWLVRFEDGWLLFYRSWTGFGIFGLQLEFLPSGTKVVDSWVSRNQEHYQSPGIDQERELVLTLIPNLFGH